MSLKQPEFNSGRRIFLKIAGSAVVEACIAASIPKPAKAYLESLDDSTEQASREPDAASTLVGNQPTLFSSFLMYHEMSYPSFKRDLMNLIRSGQQPISPDTAVNVLNSQQTIPDSLQTFMATCDDSLFSQYDSIMKATEEVANETGFFVPVTFCAIMKLDNPTCPVAELSDNTPMYNDGVHRYLTLRQVIDLIQAGHILANHTVNHALLPYLSENARNAEIEVAEQRIDAIYQMADVTRPARILAYPEGRYLGQLDYTKQSGFDLALSTLPTTLHTQETRFYAGRIKKS